MNYKLEKIPTEYFSEIYKWRQDPFAVKHNPFTPCDFKKFTKLMSSFETRLEKLYSGNDFKWGIFSEEDLLAIVGLSSINKMMKTAEIGYQVNPKMRKRGIGTSAVNNLVRLIYKETDLRKLIAMVAFENKPSCKILEKLGFKQEGLLRKHFLIGGKEVDERIYGLLKGEFTSL